MMLDRWGRGSGKNRRRENMMKYIIRYILWVCVANSIIAALEFPSRLDRAPQTSIQHLTPGCKVVRGDITSSDKGGRSDPGLRIPGVVWHDRHRV